LTCLRTASPHAPSHVSSLHWTVAGLYSEHCAATCRMAGRLQPARKPDRQLGISHDLLVSGIESPVHQSGEGAHCPTCTMHCNCRTCSPRPHETEHVDHRVGSQNDIALGPCPTMISGVRVTGGVTGAAEVICSTSLGSHITWTGGWESSPLISDAGASAPSTCTIQPGGALKGTGTGASVSGVNPGVPDTSRAERTGHAGNGLRSLCSMYSRRVSMAPAASAGSCIRTETLSLIASVDMGRTPDVTARNLATYDCSTDLCCLVNTVSAQLSTKMSC
jgi:hypothetical protein